MGSSAPPGADDRLRLNWSHPRMVSVGDTEIAVHLGGTGAPVLILPGFPESPRAFLPMAEALAREHYVILPYLPGSGPAPRQPAGGYSIARNARRMWALLDTLGARRVQLVGHDFGAGIAYQLAIDHAQHIRRLVILSSPLRGVSLRLAWHLTRLAFPGISDLLFQLAAPRIVERTYRQLVAPGFAIPPEELEHALATWVPPGRRRAALPLLRAPGNLLTLRTFRDAWIKVPTLLILGDKVRAVRRRAIEHTVEAIDQVRVKVLKDVGYFPHLERPGEVVELVTGFLALGSKVQPGTQSMGRPPA